MSPIPHSLDARIHATANKVMLNALSGVTQPKRRLVIDGVVVKRPSGRYGSGSRSYDFANRYSIPAVVVNGKVKRLA